MDTLAYRQLLGDISKQEVAELNRVFGTKQNTFFTKGWKEPASLFGWRYIQMGALWALGTGISLHGFFIKKYNILWLAAGYFPLWCYMFYNWARQPTQEIENAYRYLLEKRAATCALNANA